MSFSKAKRFEPDKVCGPPPTAYDPKHPFGSGVISFPKGDRFPQGSTPNHLPPQDATPMKRSHSSSSIGSTDSAATTKSVQGKKDHTHCNKQIADLEKELRNITMERNQLLRRRNHPINAATHGENNPAQQTQSDEVDHMAEITVLNITIQDLTSKLESAKNLEEEKTNLENERDNALANLELKEIEFSRIISQIEELRKKFEKEETLRYELEATLKQATEHKKRMEVQISEYTLKLENLEKLVDASNSYEEKLAVLKKHHEDVIEVLNKNYEKAMDNGQDLQQRLDYLRLEFQALLTATEAKETQLKAEIEKMSHTIQFKENEITLLGETLRLREKETADEWIQRETSIVAQLTEKNHKTVQDFEIRLQEVRAQLQLAKEEIERVIEERDAARDDIAVFQVEVKSLLADAEAKETQHKAEVEKMSHTIQFKENEIRHLDETLPRREKETADEWIQRETSIMAQLTEQNQKSVQEFETRLQEVRAELQQAKEEIERVTKERDAASDDVAVFQVEVKSMLDAAEAKETQHKAEAEKMSHTIQFKENEITHLGEILRIREKEAADEWITHETRIVAQLTEQNHKSVKEFETRLQEVCAELQQAKEEIERVTKERDAARDDVTVFQVQTEAQLAALNEQYDQEREMLIEKLSVQTREIEEINSARVQDLQAQLTVSQHAFKELRWSSSRQIEQMEHDHEEAILTAVREALEPVDNELESLRKDREAYLLLQKEYADLQARIEPFRDQLEMYEAEKKALLNQALFAENSMASLASKYTQLLGHQNSKQKIHHLEKLKQDIFYLRKELAEKNLALEREKKARQKADARVKELSGQKKYDPSEAFKVPDNPVAAPVVNKPPPRLLSVAKSTSTSVTTTETKEVARQQRKPLRPQVHSTGFFLSMDEVEKERVNMEREKQQHIEARRKTSANFDAFDVDFGPSSSRRETFDVPSSKQLNVTQNVSDLKQDNKENISRGMFPINDISEISVSDELVLKNKLKSRVENLTSTPVQRNI